MTLRVELPLEIFPLIFFFLRDDTRALFSCCRLNQSLLPEAAKHLYRRVSFAHPARTEPASALLPRYRDYVRELDFGSLFNFESEYGQVQFEALCALISTFAPNVQMVMFECICPTVVRSYGSSSSYDRRSGSAFCLRLMQYVLQTCPGLIDVHIESLMTLRHPDLVRVLAQQPQSETGSNKNKNSSNNLRKIRLEFADHRIINDLAAPWSRKLVENLEELELTDHEQDVYKKWEAQSLMTIFSRLQNIRRLVLCENFNDVDELLLLAQLPNLRDLTLFYHKSRHTAYNPKTHPHFTLRSLTILCSNQRSTDFYSTSDQIALAKYIIFLITPSPSNVATYQNNLEHLSLLLETQSTVAFYLRDYVSQRAHGPNSSIGFDSIIDHLIAKHSHSLKFLYLRFGFIKKKTWLRLAEGLPRLEELVFAGCKDILHSLNSAISTHLHSLRFLQIKLRNIDHSTRIQIGDSLRSDPRGREACGIMAGCQSLKTLVVDSSRFDKTMSVDPNWNGLETEEKWVYTVAKRQPNEWFHRFGGPLIN